MTKWISVKDKLPLDCDVVWVFKYHGNGPKRRASRATFRIIGDEAEFRLSGNKRARQKDWESIGLSQWFLCDRSATTQRSGNHDDGQGASVKVEGRKPTKRHYNMTLEGAAAKREKMREYWRRRKAEESK